MRVLVPTDLSEAGLLAIEGLCAADAQPFDAVILLHVIDLDLYTSGGSIPQIREWAAEELTAAASTLRERGFAVETRIDEGDVVATIMRVAAEEEADVIMLTSAGRGGAAERLFGSTAEALAARGENAVMIDPVAQDEQAWCRLGEGSPFARPLLAVDADEPVPNIAAALSSLPGAAAVRIVHVAGNRHQANEVREALDEALAAFDPGVPWELRVVTGDPVDRVLDEADAFEATLLVLMPRRRGVERVLAGSVSAALAHRARIPVLLVPSSARRVPG